MSKRGDRKDRERTSGRDAAGRPAVGAAGEAATSALTSLSRLDDLMASIVGDRHATGISAAGTSVPPGGRLSASATPVQVLDKSPVPAGEPAKSPSAPPPAATEAPVIDPAQLMRWYLEGNHRELTNLFRRCVEWFYAHPVVELNAQIEARVDRFVENFLYFMTRPDYLLAEDDVRFFIVFGPLIANLTSISHFGTTDPQLAMIMKQEHNFVMLLILLSPRNRIWLDPKVFFDAQPELASIWYTMYTLTVAGWTSETTYQNARRHVLAVDERLEARNDNVAHFFFACTYVDTERDVLVKSQFNRSIQQQLASVKICNRPQPDSIAVLSAKWFPGSAVYRSAYPLIAKLRERYRLTLVHLGPKNEQVDKSLFDRVLEVHMREGRFDIGSLAENDFQMAYYPDVGMNGESIWLSNLRLAPVQVVSYGHPASTCHSQIDYFLGGVDSELPEKLQEYYTERMVLIPGLGAHPVYPDYELRHPERSDTVIHVNCPWGFTKFNYPWLMRLREIQRRASKPLHFQFLPGTGATHFSALIPLLRDLAAIFGQEACTLYSPRAYGDYMEVMERGSVALESHPFGGYNTVVDAIHLGVPIVTREGTRFYNRCASGLLRKIGLDELVATTDEEYVEKTVRLIDDDDYRHELTAALRRIDMRPLIYDTEEPAYFRKAIDYLIENHAELARQGTREPIYIR